jgi:deoxyribonuclease V
MNLEELEHLQNKLAAKIWIPSEGEGCHLEKGDLIFSLDVQYVNEEGFVAIDMVHWEAGPQGILCSHEYVLEEYVPGYFAFREGPVLLSALQKAFQYLGKKPKLIIVDGHGIAHPRKFGVACWLGLEMNIACMGVAKEPLLRYEGELGPNPGDTLPVMLREEVVGHVIRSASGVKPVFISPGHKISLAECQRVTMGLAGSHRILEPIRRADHAARAYSRGEVQANFTFID